MTYLNPQQKARFDRVLGLLQTRCCYVAALLMSLGRVRVTDRIDTAAIQGDGKEAQLLFNPGFFNRLKDVELTAVLVHEVLHVLLGHVSRGVGVEGPWERTLFSLACDAVINDQIRRSFPDLELPGQPVTGTSLLGYPVPDHSAEEVVSLLLNHPESGRQRWRKRLMGLQPLDSHDQWSAGDSDPTLEVLRSILSPGSGGAHSLKERELWRRLNRMRSRYGLGSEGQTRRVAASAPRFQKNLTFYLRNAVGRRARCRFNWRRPNRQTVAVYPRVILPTLEMRIQWNILIALDTSGSVSDSFLAAARQVASQRVPDARVKLVSFDTACYEVPESASELKGGGGTRVQAVEEYARDVMPAYPDFIFVLTDGKTPPPDLRHPERWIWILPTWGRTDAVPSDSRITVLETE